jgi:hypothetical protein
LLSSACVNKEVTSFNRKLQKVMNHQILWPSPSSTSIIPLPGRMKCIVNLSSQNNNSFGNDLSIGTAQD